MSSGHVVMVLAGLLGALLTLSALRAADQTRPMLVAARDLVPGTVIDGSSLRIARIHADDTVLATLFGATELDALRGRVAIARVPKGTLLTHDDVRSVGAGAAPRAMSFPIPLTRAVGGALVSGDRVDVLAIDHNSGRGGYVVTGAQVLAFSSRGSGPLQRSDDATVTLAVDPDAAKRIASALETGTITLVRATGAPRLHLAAPFDPGSATTTSTGAKP